MFRLNGLQAARGAGSVTIALRVTGAVLGGYGLCAALVALLAVGLTALGLARSEAVVTASLVGFVLYLLVLLWAFSVRSLLRLWACLGCGAVLTQALVLAIQRQMA